MAVLFTTSQHSFFRLKPSSSTPTGCVDDIALCLPVFSIADISFQVVAYVSGLDKLWFEQEFAGSLNTVKAGTCTTCPTPEGEEPQIPAAAIQWDGNWTRIEENDPDEADIWVGNFTANEGAIHTTLGECFMICLYRCFSGLTGNATIKLACSEYCFYRITDTCHTSVVKYRCNEDSYEFKYADFPNFYNQVRIPMYLQNMQLPSEEKSYTKSNGISVKLFERVDEEYELLIDYIPKHWHRKLKVALGHDDLQIKNSNETGSSFWPFICKEKYEINWQDFPHQNAPASTKLTRSEALVMSNSNCS